jgi:hypothetical protein
MYIRNNTARLRAGETPYTAAPLTAGGASLTTPTIDDAIASNTTIDLGFNDADSWANDDDGLLIVQLSRQQSPTINFFKGPFCFAGTVEGNNTTPPTSPAAIASPFGETWVAGQRVFARVVASVEGRISASPIISAIVTV